MSKVDIKKFNELLTQVNSFITDAPARVEELKKQINNHNNMIVDIQHFIEFNSLNAADGYKVQAKMKAILNKRRELKEELEYLELIGAQSKRCLKKDDALSVISSAIHNKKEVIENRAYVPRVLVELFDNDKSVKL